VGANTTVHVRKAHWKFVCAKQCNQPTGSLCVRRDANKLGAPAALARCARSGFGKPKRFQFHASSLTLAAAPPRPPTMGARGGSLRSSAIANAISIAAKKSGTLRVKKLPGTTGKWRLKKSKTPAFLAEGHGPSGPPLLLSRRAVSASIDR
jgi:hypothetical protein